MRGLRFLLFCMGVSLLVISSLLTLSRSTNGNIYLVLGYTQESIFIPAGGYTISDTHLYYRTLENNYPVDIKAYDYLSAYQDDQTYFLGDDQTLFLGFDQQERMYFYQHQGCGMCRTTCECVYRFALESSTPKIIAEKPNSSLPSMAHPQFSPNRKQIAVVYLPGGVIYQPDGKDTLLQFIDVDDPDKIVEARLGGFVYHIRWSLDSRFLYVLTATSDWRHVLFYRVSPDTLEIEQIAHYEMRVDNSVSSTWSPNGRFLAILLPRSVSSMGLFILDIVSQQVREISALAEGSVVWSPDSQRLYFSETTEHEIQELADIFWADPFTGDKYQLFAGDGFEQVKFVSLEQKEIIFTKDYDNFYWQQGVLGNIWKMYPDGTGQQLILTDAYVNSLITDPKGEWIFLTAKTGDTNTIYRVRPDGSDLQALVSSDFVSEHLTLTPDNEYLIITMRDEITYETWLTMMQLDGNNFRLLPGECPYYGRANPVAYLPIPQKQLIRAYGISFAFLLTSACVSLYRPATGYGGK